MDNVERDDVLHALKYCYQFYRKPFLDIDKQVWGSMIREHNYTGFQWKEEIKMYMARGTFCPKPKEILNQLAENHERKAHKRRLEPVQIIDDCPPDISAAWRYWLPIFHGQALPFASNTLETEVSVGQAEAWLMLVNREAKRAGNPDAVPKEFQVSEVWGG